MNIQEFIDDVNGIDPNDPGSWSTPIQVIAIVFIVVALIGAGFYFMIQPKIAEFSVVERKEVTLRAEFEKKQRKIANLDAYKAQLDEMRRSFGAMLRQLPNKTEVANLLNDISQTRVASGLEEELFQPRGEVRKEFYAEIPNEIHVVGDFHEMGTFASGVAALPRIVTIDEVEIKPIASGGRVGRNVNARDAVRGDLRMKALAKTYRYLEEGEEPGAAQ